MNQFLSALRLDPTIWDLFTLEEEYSPWIRDRYGRFPYFASSNRELLLPRASMLLTRMGFRPDYPENKKFAICLTHDVDAIYCGRGRDRAFSKIAEMLPLGVISATKRMLGKDIGGLSWRNMKEIMEIEESYGAHSTFFFMALEKEQRDFNYSISEVAEELHNIVDMGWEVGLHGSHEAFNNTIQMKKEKTLLERTLGSKVCGYRGHYLKFETPITWRCLHEAGFNYDTTLGFADCVGFRNGMCHPFRPFDLDTQKVLPILEIPLVIMDVTMTDSYMRLGVSDCWRLISLVLERTAACNGVLAILWHNTNFKGESLSLFEKILQKGREMNAWLTDCRSLAAWWEPRVDAWYDKIGLQLSPETGEDNALEEESFGD